MKIFLSYGHDVACRELVHRLKSDLEQSGHDVWIDSERIGFGDDWRNAITEGIRSQDHMLALLSRHSTRDPGVCRDEIAIALGAGKAHILTILVEDEREVDPPVSISHLQWLDMRDWSKRQAEDAEAFEVWYRDKLAEILRVLESPQATRFAGEISHLEHCLRPLDCTPDIATRVQDFTGRAWLLDEIESWRLGERRSRIFWLTGAPGSGKSAVAAWLAHTAKGNVLAAQFCRFDRPERRDPCAVIRSISFQLATRLPDYRKHLINQPEIEDLGRKNAQELFDYLLANPLRYAIDGGRQRYLIVLDALDETLEDGKSDLLDLIARDIESLPDWLGLVVTSRPEPAVRRQLEAFGLHELSEDDPRNAGDLQAYTERWLVSTDLTVDEKMRASEAVLTSSKGNFLYLTQLRKAVDLGWISLTRPGELPKGLSALYGMYFRRQFPDTSNYAREIMPLLEIVLAARQPVPPEETAAILGWSSRTRAQRVERLGSLFPVSEKGIAPFHKSLRDWLADARTAGPDYFIEVGAGQVRLGEALWNQFLASEDPPAELSDFAKTELPYQLGDWAVRKLFAKLDEAATIRIVGFVKVIANEFHNRLLWRLSEAWGRLGLTLCEGRLGPDHPDTAMCQNALGFFLKTLGDYEGARPLYERSLAIHEKVLGPDYPDTAMALNNLGVLLKTLGDYEGARPLYERALAINENTLGPDHPVTAMALNNLGVLLKTLGDYEGARPLYERALVIDENILGPDHPDTAMSLSNLGVLLHTLGDHESARPLYERALAIHEKVLGPDHPDTARSLNNLAGLLKTLGDYEGARPLYERALVIDENILGPDHPDTARSLNNLAGLLKALGDYEGTRPLYERALAIHEKVLGPDHLETALNQHELAVFLREHGRVDEALPLQQTAVDSIERTLGADSLVAATAYSAMGALLNLKDDKIGAERNFRRALEIRREKLGPDHDKTRLIQARLSELLAQKGENP